MTTAVKTPVHEYLDLHFRVKDLEAELKDAKSQLQEKEQEVMDQFIEMGIREVKTLNGGPTVHLQKETHASIVAARKVEARTVLKNHDLDYMVKSSINASQLTSWVIQQDKDEIPIPDDLLDVMNVVRKTSVRVKQSD